MIYGSYDDYESSNYDRMNDDYDPRDDSRDGWDQGSSMPEPVKSFISDLYNAITERSLFVIQNLYENTFPKLTEQFYSNRPWPNQSAIETITKDATFVVLYNELYFRHLHAKCADKLTLDIRYQAFSNYCDLFNYIFRGKGPVDLVLPDQWLWELIDEFIYQFQSFSQFRARFSVKTPEEIEILSKNSNLWNVLAVLNVLHSLVTESSIKKQLEVYASGGDPDSVAGEYGRRSLYKMLGYFSLVGLLRLHSLFGDYYQAIKVLENIEIHKKSQYSHVPACQISTSYYVGFAYMMMRRYSDAIRTFSSILLYIQRTKHLFQTRTYQNDQINKQTEQMYHLLAICLVLHPQCIDESIQQHLREKNYHEKMCKMQSANLEEFKSCFLFACPKFLLASMPGQIGAPPQEDYIKLATEHQTSVFMDEIKQQLILPTIRSYLKLYTTLPLVKLSEFMKCLIQQQEGKENKVQVFSNDIAEYRTNLLCFKHKMKNMVWTKGTSGLEGSFQSGSELDFYIDGDMIHIADTKVANRYGDFFIRKIHKLEELNHKLHSIKL